MGRFMVKKMAITSPNPRLLGVKSGVPQGSVLSPTLFIPMQLHGIVVSALAWHSLGREIESCPGI